MVFFSVFSICSVHCQYVVIVVLVLCYTFGSGGANQSDVYPKMLLDSGFPVNPKIMYVCFERS